MKKDNIRHYMTLRYELFPQMLPHTENGGETKQSVKQIIDKVWEWIDNPDDVTCLSLKLK